MAQWHLQELLSILQQRGWKRLRVLPGDDYGISATWELQRSTNHPPVLIDFDGLTEEKCLPLDRAYGCSIRGHSATLYFSRKSGCWGKELLEFINQLNKIEKSSNYTSPVEMDQTSRR